MKRLSKRRASQSTELAPDPDLEIFFPYPPPDARTRSAGDLEPSSVLTRDSMKSSVVDGARRRPRAGLLTSTGLGAVTVAGGSRILGETEVLNVPVSASIGVAGAGAVLLAAGGVGRWRRQRSRGRGLPTVSLPSVDGVDLPTITGQMSAVLASLRHEHGLAYTSGTWITAVLPRHTSTALDDPTLARDLLAAAALDAGGIRANVSTIAASYSRSAIVDTCVTLLEALKVVQTSCESANGDLPLPRRSDSTSWPAEIG